MRKSLLFYLFNLVFVATQAQSISPEVISSTGGFYSNATGMISFTEGEPLGEMISSGGNVITQGFEQPDVLLVSIPDIDLAASLFSLYPNPCNGTFKVRAPESRISELEIYNVLGEKVFSSKYSDQREVLISLTTKPGVYFLVLQNQGKHMTKKMVIQ